MNQEPNLVKSNGPGKSRLTITNKKSIHQKRKQSQRNQISNQNFRYSLLQEASQKYLQQDQNLQFNFSQTVNQYQKQIYANKSSIDKLQNIKKPNQNQIMGNKIEIQKKEDYNLNFVKKSPQKLYNKNNHLDTIYEPNLIQRDSNRNKIIQFDNQQSQSSQKAEKQKYDKSYYHEPYNNFLTNQPNKITSNNLNSSKLNDTILNNIGFDSQKNASNSSDHQLFLMELQTIIFSQVKAMELKQLKGNFILQHITDDLQIEINLLQEKIKNQKLNPQKLLKVRMHIQAINKIMVFVHGKSQYRLVTSHYYIGQAYRLNGCYEQAIDHFTIALKKNTKLTQIKETKIYHSFILTSLSQCYFELQMYSDSLQILLRAYQIQQCYVNSQLKINNIKTIRLISECYLKMKNYRQAIQYMEKICLIVQRLKGNNSKQYAQIKFQKAVIVGQQGNLLGAIQQVKAAIELVQLNHTIYFFERNMIILQYNKKLAQFLQRFGDFESQVQCLKQMLKIIDSQKVQGFRGQNIFIKHIIAIKKKIIVIAVKHSNFQIAINELQQVLSLQEQKQGAGSVYVSKTLKMLGLVHLHLGNERHAQQYFKKCYRLNEQLKQNKGQIKQIQEIFKYLGYNNRGSFVNKRNSLQGNKRLSVH